MIENQFLAAAREAGIPLTERIIADGTLHRSHIEGHKSGTKNGAYNLHLDGRPAGWCMDYKTGATMTWRADGRPGRLSPLDRAAIEAERRRREAERRQAHAEASKKAARIWSQTQSVTDPLQHGYLITKRIKPHGARLSVYGGRRSLVIPVANIKGQITSLQFIDENGDKRFLPGGEIKGCLLTIYRPGVCYSWSEPGRRILICEGFATGASLAEWYRESVIVAFNAGNLEPVAKQIRQCYPDAEIIVCGDNDESGVGQKAARAAALACKGKYLLPPVVGQDFNDAVNAWRDAAQEAAA